MHVVPKLQMGACFGAPPVDFLPQQDPVAYDQLVKQAEAFIQMRFLPSLHSLRVHPIVHIVKVPTQASVQVPCSLIDVPVNANHFSQGRSQGAPMHITPLSHQSLRIGMQ